jgi:hypothetical protein
MILETTQIPGGLCRCRCNPNDQIHSCGVVVSAAPYLALEFGEYHLLIRQPDTKQRNDVDARRKISKEKNME